MTIVIIFVLGALIILITDHFDERINELEYKLDELKKE